MDEKPTVEDVIIRLEAASEGSRALDDDIAIAIGWERIPFGDAGLVWRAPDREIRAVSLRYTESIDAALALVPEGWVFPMNNGIHQAIDEGQWYWGCALAQLGIAGHGWVSVDWRTTKPPTPALAVCIAALKARQAEKAV